MTQAALDARDAAMDGAVGEYADSLYSFRKLLPSLYPDKPGFEMPELVYDDPSNPGKSNSNYKRIAKALLEDGKVRIQGKDGQFIEVTLDDADPNSLDARDTKNGSVFKNSLGVKNLNALGSGKRAKDFSEAVQNAVEKNSSDVGFLKGASWGNAISGLMSWFSKVGFLKGIGGLLSFVFSGFKKMPDGLEREIAETTAKNIRSDLTENLKGKGYTHDEVKKAGDAVYYATMEKAGFADPKAPKKADPRSIAPITMDDAKVAEMRNKVYNAALYPEGQKDLGTQIGEQFVEAKRSGFFSNNFGWVRGVTESKLMAAGGKVATSIAGSIADFTTNPDSAQRLYKMSREQYAATVAKNAVENLRRDQAAFGLPDTLTEEQLDKFRARIETAIANDYDKLHMATSLAATNVKQPTLASGANSAFEQARASVDMANTGISGASLADDGNLGELAKQALAAKNTKDNKPGIKKPGAPTTSALS